MDDSRHPDPNQFGGYSSWSEIPEHVRNQMMLDAISTHSKNKISVGKVNKARKPKKTPQSPYMHDIKRTDSTESENTDESED